VTSSDPSCGAPAADAWGAERELDFADGRESLADFCALIAVPGAPVETDEDRDGCGRGRPRRRPLAAHHRLLISRLEALERGEITRLMVFMPPGSAKSTYASVVFPAWFLGRAPNRSVIVATYACDLARKIGRRMRTIVRSSAFRGIFGKTLRRDQAAAGAWALDDGAELLAGGILSGLTGNRADLIVIDDPVKGRAEADSPTVRARTRAEYDDTLKTRLKPGGRIVLIQTRWHEDDLAGSILPEDWEGASGAIECRDGETWEVLSVPAIAERPDDPLGRKPGERLWPEWFSEAHFRPYRLQPRTWAALYQQRPKPEEGAFFPRSAFRRFAQNELPPSLRVFGTSDYAVTEGGGDFTRHRLWGLDQASPPNLWLVDGWGGRTGPDVWIEAKLDLIEAWRPRGLSRWFGEAGVIQKAVEPMLRRRMKERRVSCPIEWLASVGDKAARARAAQALLLAGRVRVRADADGDCFVDECAAFPAGRWDDEVDCFSLIGRAVDRLGSGRPPGPRAETAERGRVFE
jgi:predicted phage terminase large subunit-like protein